MSPPRASARSDAPYRIKVLSEISGVSREAIRFYINEGLLPPPKKTSHNMGWYSERHVELLRLIQKLQTERYLPLKAIKLVLHGKEALNFTEPQNRAFEEMRRKVISEHRDLKVSDDAGKLAAQLGLSRWEQKELRDFGLAASGSATMSDVEIARQWILIRDAGLSLERGFSPKLLEFMNNVVDIAFRAELEIFNEHVIEIDDSSAVKVVEVVIPALSRIFSLLHERRVTEFLKASTAQPLPAAPKARSRRRAVEAPVKARSKKPSITN